MNGQSGYLEWAAPLALRRYVACSWTGGLDALRPDPAPEREPVLPDACMDVIWDGVRLLVAGPDRGPSSDAHEGAFTVGLRWRPGMAPLFLGSPASELLDERIDLCLLWPEADELRHRLSAATSLREAATVLEAAVEARLPSLGEPDPLVEAAAREWRWGSSPLSTTRVAERSGLSERQVHRRFVDGVGYGPKMLQRVLRFQAFLGAAAGAPERPLGELAHAVGYADQSHLTRESARLSGRTPAELRAARNGSGQPDVRNVQDPAHRPGVQRPHGHARSR